MQCIVLPSLAGHVRAIAVSVMVVRIFLLQYNGGASNGAAACSWRPPRSSRSHSWCRAVRVFCIRRKRSQVANSAIAAGGTAEASTSNSASARPGNPAGRSPSRASCWRCKSGGSTPSTAGTASSTSAKKCAIPDRDVPRAIYGSVFSGDGDLSVDQRGRPLHPADPSKSPGIIFALGTKVANLIFGTPRRSCSSAASC